MGGGRALRSVGERPGREGRREVAEGICPARGLPREGAAAWEGPRALAARVRGDERVARREAGLPWHVLFERQEERLRQQARALGLPTDWSPPVEARALEGGAEHHLWEGRDGRMYKMTKADHFGQVPCHNPDSSTGWENFAAAPVDYLERLALMNEVFDDDVRVEGLRCRRTVAIAISQPLAKPARATRPHPRGVRMIEAFMGQRGFVNLGFAAWYDPVRKLMVTDATPDNFVQTRGGLAPVDLMICRAEGELLEVLEGKVASGEANDERRWGDESEKGGG